MQKYVMKYLIISVGFILINGIMLSFPTYANTDSREFYPNKDGGEIPSSRAVWSSWFWPFSKDYPPNLYGDGEAMERYDKYDKGKTAKKWEYQNHGPPRHPASWWGHCHAWAAAACWVSQPTTSKILDGVTFRVRDRKGLMTAAYYNSTDGSYLEFYANDPSPGLFWRYLRNEIRGDKPMHGQSRAFVGELYYGSEIWNYPIYKYEVEYSSRSPYSGTIKIWYANDNEPLFADSTSLHYATKTYYFKGVKFSGTAPVNSGLWIGSGSYHRPDAIWRPYVAKTWTQYTENPELDNNHLSQILSP